MRSRAVKDQQRLALQFAASLLREYPETLLVQARQKSRKHLAHKRFDRNVQVHVLIPDLLPPDGARPNRRPPPPHIRARANSKLVLKLNVRLGKCFGQRAKVFLYVSTLLASCLMLTGRAVLSLIRSRAHSALTPPIVYVTLNCA